VTDIRKVRPVAALDAERHDSGLWTVWSEPIDSALTDAEFAAAFAPAELFDAVLDAARATCSHHQGSYAYSAGACSCDLCAAVRSFDAHRPTT